jgi:uncharacterized protein YndB with AHSA1/START domain
MIEKVFTIEIRASAARVWEEITRSGGPIHPMFGTYLHGEFKAGSVISHRTRSGSRTFVVGEVLEVQPPTRLVHTFRFAMHEDAATLVVWELKESAGVTRVTITHSRFTGETQTLKSIQGGWPRILSLYKSLVETGGVPLGARLQNTMMSWMAFMLPARTKTERALAVDMKVPEGV